MGRSEPCRHPRTERTGGPKNRSPVPASGSAPCRSRRFPQRLVEKRDDRLHRALEEPDLLQPVQCAADRRDRLRDGDRRAGATCSSSVFFPSWGPRGFNGNRIPATLRRFDRAVTSRGPGTAPPSGSFRTRRRACAPCPSSRDEPARCLCVLLERRSADPERRGDGERRPHHARVPDDAETLDRPVVQRGDQVQAPRFPGGGRQGDRVDRIRRARPRGRDVVQADRGEDHHKERGGNDQEEGRPLPAVSRAKEDRLPRKESDHGHSTVTQRVDCSIK